MDRLDAMSLLVAAVETGSLSGAGRRHGVPLPTVSRRIADLEAYLGAKLLIRSTRRLRLTDAGAAYVGAARSILGQVSEAERAAAGEFMSPTGELIVTAPLVFGRLHLLPTVCALLAAYPEIDVRMVLSDRRVHLIEDHVDVALRIGELPDSRLKMLRLGTLRHVVCASPDFLERHGPFLGPSDLVDAAAVTFETLGEASAWTFGRGAGQIGVPVRTRLRVDAAEAAVDAAAAGVGLVRVLHYQAAAALADGRLRLVLEDFEPEPWPVSLVHAAQEPLPLKLRVFLDFAAPRLRAGLAALSGGG